MGNSGDLLSVSGTRPSTSAAHSASSPLVESEKIQLGSEVELIATTTMESIASTVATQMDSPVSSPSSSATREVESNTGDGRRHELPAGSRSAPGQSELDGTTCDDTFESSGLSVTAVEHDDDSCDTVVIEPPVSTAQCVFTSSPGSPRASEPQSWPTPSSNDLILSMQQMIR